MWGTAFFMAEQPNSLTSLQNERYQRHIVMHEIGEIGQLRLLRSRVLVIGAGGLGSPALLYLAACGVGEIGLVDSDHVELSNLQRQILHGEENLGEEKTCSARRSILRLRSDVRLQCYPVKLTKANAGEIIARYDFIIEATDNFESKFLINDVCLTLGKPFSQAGILGMYGQTMTVIPGKSPCFRCVFGEVPPPESVKTTEEVGVLGSVPGVLGAIQATEAIKHLAQFGDLLLGRLLTWDALTMTFREVKLPSETNCEICKSIEDKR
jgi:molybdopterin/thiamine biosynthesis adenylyltransferase